LKGPGNSYDFGARIYDPKLGRRLSTDPLQTKYPFASPYNFVLNTPIQANDPDGRVVIFINGQHGAGNVKATYWGDWATRAKNRIGDNKSRFYDGAIGGWKNTKSWAKAGYISGGVVGAYNFVNEFSNVNPEVRKKYGYLQGKTDA